MQAQLVNLPKQEDLINILLKLYADQYNLDIKNFKITYKPKEEVMKEE